MNFYTNKTFKGYYPVGTAAVVKANSREEAAQLLNNELQTMGLETISPEEMIDITHGKLPEVFILNDGNY